MPPGGRRRRPGLLVHRRVLPTEQLTRRHAIPVTSPPRTLVDPATAAALTPLRFTHHQVAHQAEHVEGTPAAVVGRRGA